ANAEAFNGLNRLRLLNTTECSLSEFKGEGLVALEELDISFNKITKVEGLWSEGSKIRVLNARNNSMKRLSPTALDGLQHLEELDISGNPWICDSKIIKTTEWVTKRYRMAQKRNLEFLLKNANETLCDRPYNKRGQLIFELTERDVIDSYNERSDTTTPVPTASTASVEEQLENVTINWQRFTVIAGDESNNTLELAKDDVLKPAYDINSVRYGEKHAEGPRNASVAPVLILGTACLLTAVGIVLVLYQKTKQDRRRVDVKDEKADATGDTAV
ncbi:leucine Rich Repeat family protein, partial [Aphelenchoides avenae]